jgi:hypothetical protein
MRYEIEDSSRGGRSGKKGREERDAPFQIAVHNGEKDLQEQVDGIYKHGEEV